MFDVSVLPWQQMLMEKPREMTLGVSCNVISTMCEYEISNGFKHIRAVFISSIYSPLVSKCNLLSTMFHSALAHWLSGSKGCGRG